MKTPATAKKNAFFTNDAVIVSLWLLGFLVVGVVFVWVGAYSHNPLTAVLWALACFVLGTLVGFLFGIPRVLQGSPTLGNPTSSDTALQDTPAQKGTLAYDLRVNTNLEQISDWLTKIIVGLGLIELRNVPAKLKSAAGYLARGLGGNTEYFAGGLIVYFTILGFLGAYLVTRLYISVAFSRADRDASKQEGEEVDQQRVKNLVRVVPSEDKVVSDVAAVDKKAAQNVASRPFSELASPEETATWAKAQLSLGNYDDAVKAYGQIPNLLSTDLDKLFAYATALYYSGDKEGALQQLLQAYKKLTPTTDPELRRDIYRSLTFQALFQAAPRSFDDAIRYGEEYVTNNQNLISPGVWANLASAYGQKMTWLLANNPTDQDALTQTRTRALAVVQQTAGMGERWKKKIREMMDKDFPNKDSQENDLEVFSTDPDFRRAAGLPDLK
jgi:tetratricopeptide (TPR) repeat protein